MQYTDSWESMFGTAHHGRAVAVHPLLAGLEVHGAQVGRRAALWDGTRRPSSCAEAGQQAAGPAEGAWPRARPLAFHCQRFDSRIRHCAPRSSYPPDAGLTALTPQTLALLGGCVGSNGAPLLAPGRSCCGPKRCRCPAATSSAQGPRTSSLAVRCQRPAVLGGCQRSG